MAKTVFKTLSSNQSVLFPSNLLERIPANHPVLIVNQAVDQLNIDCLLSRYKGGGTSACHSRMLLKVLFYGYLSNLYSCRKIAKALQENIYFMWLSGNSLPDFRTINRFRGEGLKEEIKSLFTQIVLLLQEAGYLSLDVQYIDGTRIESASSKYTFVRLGSAEKHKSKLEDKIRSVLSLVDSHIEEDRQAEKFEDSPKAIDSDLLREKVKELNTRLDRMDKIERKQVKQLQEDYLPRLEKKENRVIEINYKLMEYKRKARERLMSEQGVRHRGKRCMEPEAVFGQIKHNSQFNRFRLRGLEKVNIEFTPVAIAHNLRKWARKAALSLVLFKIMRFYSKNRENQNPSDLKSINLRTQTAA